MSFDYDLDELEDSDLDYSMRAPAEELDSEYDEPFDFEDIDFEALGIDPAAPTGAKPGSEEKVLMLAARYAAGVPLWHDEDCYDHGPGENFMKMLRSRAQERAIN